MTTSTTHQADKHLRLTRALRFTAATGLVGGCAFVVDTVTIAVINNSFGTLDNLLFGVGLLALLVTLLALAAAISIRATGGNWVAWGVGTFLGALAVIGVLAQIMDTMGHHVFSPANKGLHGEWSFFTVGVCLLLIAGWANRSRSDEQRRDPRTTRS
jgi:hypothetical protein